MDMEAIGIGAGVLVIGGLAMFSGGSESAAGLLQSGNQIKELRQENAFERVLKSTNAEAQATDSELAWQRYENGCVVHATRAQYQRPEDKAIGSITVEYRRVVEGETPLDFNGQQYSPGTILCDSSGGTGMIDDSGVVIDYAYTGQDVTAYVVDYFGRWH